MVPASRFGWLLKGLLAQTAEGGMASLVMRIVVVVLVVPGVGEMRADVHQSPEGSSSSFDPPCHAPPPAQSPPLSQFSAISPSSPVFQWSSGDLGIPALRHAKSVCDMSAFGHVTVPVNVWLSGCV